MLRQVLPFHVVSVISRRDPELQDKIMLMESQFSGERRQVAAGRMKAQDTAQEETHRWGGARNASCLYQSPLN
jgi:hypothetical protein